MPAKLVSRHHYKSQLYLLMLMIRHSNLFWEF
jgi:hypothetical protein